MLRRTILCLALLCPAARAGDPAVDAFRAKFAPQEQILLAGVLTDPAQAAEFAKDARGGGGPAVMTKWYGRISAFSSDYLSRKHTYNDGAALAKDANGKLAGVQHLAEPAEWNMLMDALRKMKNGGLLDQGKLKIFVGMIDDANDDLSRGDTESGHKVVDMGRKNLLDALNEYLASRNGKTGIADAARQRQEDETRKKAQPPPPAVVQPQPDPVLHPAPATTVKAPVKNTTDETKPADELVSGDDALAKQAREQAERIRQELQTGGNGDKGYAGDRSQGGTTSPVVAGNDQASEKTGLSPVGVGGGTPNLTVKEPPSPSGDKDDLAELHQLKDGVKGHKTLFATIGGGLLGAILGGLIGFLFGGPLGLAIGAAAGAAAGAIGGHMLGKKLWG